MHYHSSSLLLVFLLRGLGFYLALLVLCLVGEDRVHWLQFHFGFGFLFSVGLQLEAEDLGNKFFAFEVWFEIGIGLRGCGFTMRRRWGKEVPK